MTSTDSIQCPRPRKTSENTREPIRMNTTIAVMRMVPMTLDPGSQSSSRCMPAMAPADAPMPARWGADGIPMPGRPPIDPSTAKIRTAEGMMPVQALDQRRGQVRGGAFGMAGTNVGPCAARREGVARTSAPAGSTAPGALVHVAHRRPSWSASTTSTSEGGTSWVMVPDASTPVA